MKSYSAPDIAASNIVELIEYLLKHNHSSFFYRGQTKEYDGPLVPSAYRGNFLGNRIKGQTGYSHSMRKIGQEFYRVNRFKNFDDIFMAYSGEKFIQSREEVKIVHDIVNNPSLTKLICENNFITFMQKIFPESLHAVYKSRFEVWETVINQQHKGLLRLNGANEFLGYRLGQTLSQHYIESSEYLDVTNSVAIAAFFGTLINNSKLNATSSKIGIIYRFDTSEYKEQDFTKFDYYSAPPYIDAIKVLKTLEKPNLKFQWNPKEFVIQYILTGGIRDFEILKLPEGSLENTRIGRQRSAFLLPDEIHHETRDHVGNQNVSFQAIEDLSKRKGVEKFYFKHSDVELKDKTLSSEWLWPHNEKSEKMVIDLLNCIVLSEEILSNYIKSNNTRLFRVPEPDLWIPERTDLIRSKAPVF